MNARRAVPIALVVAAIAACVVFRRPGPAPAAEAWSGVDDAVIGRFVAEAGRPAPHPVFDWVQGDLLLFAFLWAGLIAGFALGYWGRALVEGAPAQPEPPRGSHDA